MTDLMARPVQAQADRNREQTHSGPEGRRSVRESVQDLVRIAVDDAEPLRRFWETDIRPRFDESALNHSVLLADGTRTRYANLDNATTTTPFLRVTREVESELCEYGSIRRGAGRKAKISTARYEETRGTIRRFLNAAETHYVIFTMNTTTAMNQVAHFFAPIEGKVLVSDMEHSASTLSWIFREGWRQTADRVTLDAALSGQTREMNQRILDRGREQLVTCRATKDFTVDLDDVERILRNQKARGGPERIKAVVATGASNVTGYKPPLRELARIAHRYGAMIVVDGCQLLQHERIDMREQELDFVVFSGHKMYAPFGSGVIVGDKRLLDAFWSYQMGGGNFPYLTGQNEVVRFTSTAAHDPGTPNFPGARAIHHAIHELQDIGIDRIASYERGLVRQALAGLESIPGVQLAVPADTMRTFDGTMVAFNIRGLPYHLVAEALDSEYGIGTRAGAHCVFGFTRRAAGITDDEDARIAEEVRSGRTCCIPGSVRASFCLYNNLDDVERLVEAVDRIASEPVEQLMSRYQMNDKTGEWSLRQGLPSPATCS
ncbi:MAG: aminotransferase class V-fold PLP-dependent enzyme [Solirubrobacterales bacterium]